MNAALVALRQLIPTEPQDRRLSKVETLRLAAGYIAHLDAVRARLQGTPGPLSPPPCRNTLGAPGSLCTFCVAESKRSAAKGVSELDMAFRSRGGNRPATTTTAS